jgi:hypothetical protein
MGRRVIRQMYSTISSRYLASDENLVCLRNDSVRNLSTQEQNIVRSPYPDISVPDISLVDFVWEMVDVFPDRTALVSMNKIDL